MKQCLIAVGSNLSNSTLTPIQVVEKAFELIPSESAEIIKISPVYRTPSFPIGSGPDFFNAAVSLHINCSPCLFLKHLHSIEHNLERKRNTRWSARSCDLDLLAVGDLVLPDRKTYNQWANLDLKQQMTLAPNEMILPHPRLAERAFVLVPLADIAPDWKHPITDKTVKEMLAELPCHAFDGIEKVKD